MLKGQYSFLPITVSWPIDVKHPPLKKKPFMGIMNVPVHLRTVLPWVWLQNTKDKFNWYGYIVVKFILFSKTKFISSASKILKKKKMYYELEVFIFATDTQHKKYEWLLVECIK